MKRVKKLETNPNPLFLQWLTEMRLEAEQRNNVNRMKIYSDCIASLEKYPLPFENGKQCQILNGFGKKICEMLDKRLEDYRRNNNKALDFPVSPVAAKTSLIASKLSPIVARTSPPVSSNMSPIAARSSPPVSLNPSPVATKSPGPLKSIDNIDRRNLNNFKPKPVLKTKSSVFDESWNSDCGEDRDLKLALELSQTHTRKDIVVEDDDDLQVALRLSQAEFDGSGSKKDLEFDASGSKQDLERTQEEDDHELAMRLQREWNDNPQNNADELPEMPDDSFELPDMPDDSFELPDPEGRYDIPEIPDIPYDVPDLPEMHSDVPDLLEMHYDVPDLPDLSPGMSSINPRLKKLATAHDISSSEDSFSVEHNAKGNTPMDDLFANDPVFRKATNAARESPGTQNNKKKTPKATNPRLKKLAANHNISTSDDSIPVEDSSQIVPKKNAKAPNAMDNLFANDPVFNRAAKVANSSSEASSRNNSRAGKTPKSKKEYVPKPRSGAYALLVTLYRESCKDGYPGYINRTSLQTKAQPLSDQSFAAKNAHSEFYTAWSSMKTLIKNELVVKWSNPAKYNITEKGQQLAARVVRVETGGEEEGLGESINEAPSEIDATPGKGKNKKTPNRGRGKRKENTPAKTPPKRQKVADDSEIYNHPDVSELRKRRIEALGGNAPKPDNDVAQGTLGALNDDDDADLAAALRLNLLDSKADKSSANFDLDLSNFSPCVEQPSASSSRPPAPSLPKTATSLSRTSSTTSTSSGLRDGSLPMALSLKRNVSNPRPPPGVDRHQPEFQLAAGTFDILLCVDNTEVAGGGAGGRKSLKTETVRHLEEHNVPYHKRNLNIGDFLWIARERVEEVDGQFRQKQPRELVLPYLVERKRLDDLWMSVKDGRYEEQKFRMQSSGSVYLYYLVEDFKIQHSHWGQGTHGNMVTPESIEQAVANTAAQQGFSISRTRDQRGTVEYLTIFTRILRKKYLNKDLTSCTHLDLAEETVVNRDTTLLTFVEFNDTSKKNKKLTLREIFAKMLLRLKGLSVEMAHSITQRYPTPQALLEAYRRAGSEANKVKLIQEMTYGIEGKRKIPKTIAEAMVTFWTKNTL